MKKKFILQGFFNPAGYLRIEYVKPVDTVGISCFIQKGWPQVFNNFYLS